MQLRYEKYAEAEAWLLDSGLIIPTVSQGATPSVTKSVPFTKAYSPVGVKGSGYNFKLTQLQKDVVTTKEYEAAKKKWKEEATAANKKAQEELADHVEK